MVRRMTSRNGETVRDVAIDGPALHEGWWAVERDASGPYRWTNGDAVLPNPGAGILEVVVAGTMRYPAEATHSLSLPDGHARALRPHAAKRR
jgi:hypothetical protein